jgi:SARP family transcriptional regulator, regulator of embCAB operon
MEAFARQGNIAEALRVYESLRGLLREALGAAPSPSVQQMHERLLTHKSVG